MTALEAVLRTLEDAGLNYTVMRTTHYRVLFQVDGRRYRVPVSISDSNWREPWNARAMVRRILRSHQSRD